MSLSINKHDFNIIVRITRLPIMQAVGWAIHIIQQVAI